jgi:ribosomal protein L32
MSNIIFCKENRFSMRKCMRCQTEMIENCDIKIEGGGNGIVIASGTKVFASRLGKPKVTICPNCGEVSLYIDNVEKLCNYSGTRQAATQKRGA